MSTILYTYTEHGHLASIPTKVINYSALSLCAWKAGDTDDAQRVL